MTRRRFGAMAASLALGMLGPPGNAATGPSRSAPQHVADGASAAPPGPPQLPTLLRRYVARPPWAVAGVDYHVGVPAGIALLDPASISMPGVSVDHSRQLIRITGNHVTLSGYDFGLGRGWGVYIPSGASDTVVENSRFHLGPTNYVPLNAAQAGNLTVRNCTFDGGATKDGTAWAMVNYAGSGKVIIEFNLFKEVPVDAIDFGRGELTAIVRYNLFTEIGSAPGAHPDSVQFDGTTATNSVIAFNTVTSGEQGIQLSAQDNSALLDSAITNNVVVAQGPERTISYLIAAGQSPGSRAEGILIKRNFLDYTGAFGPFYRPVGTRMTYADNIDMVTGVIVAAPAGTSPSDVTGVLAAPPSGVQGVGSKLEFTLLMSTAASVTGSPVLRLSNGSTAAYSGGSGTSRLTFSYTVSESDRSATALAVLGVRVGEGGAIEDPSGNEDDLSAAAASFPHLSVKTRGR